nr:MAG TPA: Pyocin activator protein PrtN [Caudoviricetes sp.]
MMTTEITPEVARRIANAQSLPWPVIPADGNKKSPKFVSVSALAEWP